MVIWTTTKVWPNNALEFDIKLFCSDGGILETLNKYNGSYHKKGKNQYGQCKLER